MQAGSDFSSYITEIEAECEKLSRTTSKGILASEASPSKAGHLLSVANADELRTITRSNLQEAISYLSHLGRLAPMAEPGARALVIAVNAKLTQDVSRSPGALRDFDSDIYPYVQADTVPGYLDQFSRFFSQALKKGGLPVAGSASTVAKVHWDVNIRGHFFADGCGRTATILGAWAYWISQGSIPRLPVREEYLDLAKVAREDWFTRGLAQYVTNHAE
jgi:hypothetical protein